MRRALGTALAASLLALAGASLLAAWDEAATPPVQDVQFLHPAPIGWWGGPPPAAAPEPHPLLPAAHANHFGACPSTSYIDNAVTANTVPSFISPDGTYGINDTIRIRVDLYLAWEPHAHRAITSLVTHTRILLETGDMDRFAVYDGHQQGTNAYINYTYTVREGDHSDDLDYASPLAMYWQSGSNTFNGRNCHLSTPGTSDYQSKPSLAVQGDIVVDGITPRVLNVTSGTPGGTYGVGSRINFSVLFSEPVEYSGSPPFLPLVLGGSGEAAAAAAGYLSGSGTSVLDFAYTVPGGAGSAGLAYAGAVGLPPGGSLADAAGNPANLTLPGTGANGSLAAPGNIAIDTSGTTAYPTGVSSPNASRAYLAGEAIHIAVEFNRTVDVVGEPRLGLATSPPRNATYASGGGTGELTFLYTVRPGDSAARLDYANGTALVLAGGGASIRSPLDGTPAGLALPDPGVPGSLGRSNAIVIDARPPSAVSAAPAGLGGSYVTGRTVDVTVALDESAVVVAAAEGGRTPTLALAMEPPRNATYAGGNGTALLSFSYTVQPGDSAVDLDYADTAALSLNGAAIRDRLGNEALADSLFLPAQGTAGSLSGSGDIGVHGGALPVLAAAGSATENQDGFDELDGANGVAAFAMDGRTFAIVASEADDGVQLIRVHDNGTLEAADSLASNNDDIKLNDAMSVDVFRTANGTVLALVVSYADSSVQMIRVHDNGTLEAAGSLGSILGGATGVDVFRTANGTAFALVTAYLDDAVHLVRVHDNGTLEAARALAKAADSSLVLNGAAGVAAFRTANGTTLALVASLEDDGVQLVRAYDNGTLAAVGSATRGDDGIARLDQAYHVSVLEGAAGGGNSTLAMVASFDRPHVQLLRIHDNGTIEAEGSAADGQDGFDELGGARASDFFTMGGRAYSIVASLDDDGVQLVRVHEDGELDAAGSAGDGLRGLGELDGAHGIDVFEMGGGRTFAIVASEEDDGVQLIRLSPASVTSVSSPLPDAAYPAGYPIRIAVDFDSPVSVSGPPPSLMLALDGGRHAEAEYLSGSGTRSLVFDYTARQGDNAEGLEYAGRAALATRGIVGDLRAAGGSGTAVADTRMLREILVGGLRAAADSGTAVADLELPAHGSPGSLGGGRAIRS